MEGFVHSTLWEQIGRKKRLFIIAGPCVMESYDLMCEIAHTLKAACEKLELIYIFKSSYDKANRTSVKSFRGPGLEKGLEWLHRIKTEMCLNVLTDIHCREEARRVSEVVDVLQIPAFLCRQTDLLLESARTGKIINVKKGQFMAPWDMKEVLDKLWSCGNMKTFITERGTVFGYNNLVVDMRAIERMRRMNVPVVFDATHSVQQPGGLGTCSGGERDFASILARSAVAAGADGVFLEVHPDPGRALCDGPNSMYLKDVPGLLEELKGIFELLKETYGRKCSDGRYEEGDTKADHV